MKLNRLIIPVIFAAIIAVSSCKKDDNNNNNNSGSGKAYVQFVNCSASDDQHPSLYDATSSTNPFLSDFYYILATPYDYKPISDFKMTLKNFAHGTILTTPQLPCEADKVYSFFAYDTFPNVKYLFIRDSVTSLPAGKSAVKFVNLSPNSGTVSFKLAGGATLAGGVTYAGSNATNSSTSYILIDANSQPDFQVVDAGNTVITHFGYPDFVAESGKSYTLYLTGYNGEVYPKQLQLFWTYDEIVP